MPEGSYKLTIIDNNSCKANSEVFLDAPERTDWQISGNANTNPANNFIGTTDAQDVTFRTDNLERFRIKGNGDIILPTLAPATGYSLLGIDSTGKTGPILNNQILTPWYINGNNNINDQVNFIGPTNAGQDLVFKTNPLGGFGSPTERMRITDNGRVFIGTSNTALASDYKLAVNGNIIAEKVLVSHYTNWPDYVFKKDYKLLSFKELEEYIEKNNHLPGIPSAAEVKKEGQDLGSIQTELVKQNEELNLRVIELNKRIEKLEKLITNK